MWVSIPGLSDTTDINHIFLIFFQANISLVHPLNLDISIFRKDQSKFMGMAQKA